MLKHSGDTFVRDSGIQVKSGRKWKAAEATEVAEQEVRFRDVIGATQTGRHGFGYGSSRVWWSSASDRQRRDLVVREVHDKEEAARYHTAVQQSQQGQWTAWEEALQRSITWSDIWHMPSFRLSFIIRAAYDQLPTSENLVKFKLATDKPCGMCGGAQALKHVLSTCKEAL